MDRALQRRYRIRVVLFLAGVVGVLAVLNVGIRTANTLRELDAVEVSRDNWQRPDEILRALELKTGSSVADIGSGAGYFALKLSRQVGSTGQVVAVDLRRTPLFFLWLRAKLRSDRNIQTHLGRTADPGLFAGAFDGVLILNTYHEFEDSRSVLSHVFRALRPGARIVVVDRSMSAAHPGESDHHAVPLARVESELRKARFEVVETCEAFIDRLGDRWWLVVGRKPE